MCILAAFWGQGIGRTMMELSLEWARLRGLRKLFLKVYHDNERAIALYRSFGFAEEARLAQDVLRADGSYGDSMIMVRYLGGVTGTE